ncbi:YopX family protein [Elizabethkingia bruuniana]|uniref:YopX family protein n=1 Tax=Elizabethkingia bruuniana TaxID=1756149 RepID=UPI000998EBA9|nr:YopX family protein [Elizabethkingia bruuniana]OPC53467.1 hypothetical protein BAY07_15565 [Elizabethkingia bruuniana]
MKREIIFRGLTLDGKWKYGYYFRQGAFSFIQNEKGGNEAVLPESVGQFTGILDCKGNRIFEGDILKGKYLVYHQDPELLPIEHDISGEVKFIEGFFACENFSFVYPEYEVEITGNIHESLTPNK